MRRDQSIQNNYLKFFIGVVLFCIGFFFNSFLYIRYAFFQEWIGGKYCIGDLFYVVGLSLIFYLVYRNVKDEQGNERTLDIVLFGALLWCIGYCCNYFLYPRYPLFQDIFYFDNGIYSIGDCFFLLGYSTILSVLWRGDKYGEQEQGIIREA